MSAKDLKSMKEKLVDCTKAQFGNLEAVDTHELGEAIDMIKDLAEAIYYCTITESMEKSGEEKGETNINYYTTPVYRMDPDQRGGYDADMMNEIIRDPREGRSPMRRKMYMESKEMHSDPASQMKELEIYLQELSKDVTEMVRDASPEERNMLRQKMMTLANKIVTD